MKRITFIIIALISICAFASCSFGSVVGKNYAPNGSTPCPATMTLVAYEKMMDAASKSDNATTIDMMMTGEILMLDVTKSYKIVEEGKNWYKISLTNGKEYYVAPHMGKVK